MSVEGSNAPQGSSGGEDIPSAGPGDFQKQLDSLEASFAKAQADNIALRKLTTEEGTELNAAKKDVNPK